MNKKVRFQCFLENGKEIRYEKEINIMEYSNYRKCFEESCEEESIDGNTKIARFVFN